MSTPRTLVTGGTGFVGRFIVERLLQAGHQVSVWGRNPPAPEVFSRPVSFVEGRLDPDRNHEAALAGTDFLVHAAFDHLPGRYRGGEGEDPAGFRARNLDGSAALFEAARRAGVGRVVFTSSRAVYGEQAPGATLTEQTEPRPDTLYGEVKLKLEQALAGLRGEAFQTVSLRVTGVYGPAADGQRHKWADLFQDYLSGRPIAARVATEVHGADVAEAVRLVLEVPGPAPPVLNVSDLVLDRRDLLALVREMTGSVQSLPERSESSALNVMDTARLRSLGWEPGGWPLLEATLRAMLAPDRG